MSFETVVFLLIADAFIFLNIGGMIGFMICALFVAAKDEREGRKMSKEKQIEEMAKAMCRSCKPNGNCELDDKPCNTECIHSCRAEILYDAGYRKQSENVIELPCKVGDTAYCVYRGTVTQGIVRLIRPFVSEQEIIFKGNLICEVDNLFIDDGTKEKVELYIVFEKPYGIERVAYLTREEAEKALAKMKGGGE
jgi:hypothetical protein